MRIFSRKPRPSALPFPATWVPGDAVEPFHVRWGRDPHNDALIDESALWSRFADSLEPGEVRWMVGPVTGVFPDINDVKAPGLLFCTDRRFIIEVTPEGRAWHDYRTLELRIADVRSMGPSQFGDHILAIEHGDHDPPRGVFLILQEPLAPYLYAVMGLRVEEVAGLNWINGYYDGKPSD